MQFFGFIKSEEVKGPNPAHPKQTSALKSMWSHPDLGSIEVDHLAHTFQHRDVTAEPQDCGKASATLAAYLKGLSREEAPKKKVPAKKAKKVNVAPAELAPAIQEAVAVVE